MVMDLSLLYLRSYLKRIKLISLSIWVVLWLKYPKNRDTASGSLSEMVNSLNRGSLCTGTRSYLFKGSGHATSSLESEKYFRMWEKFIHKE